MKKSAHILAVLILIFNGISACFGGWMLITSPDGSSLGMTTGLLEYSPFTDFLIPGIVLFTVIGLFSLVSAYLVVRQVTRYSFLVNPDGINPDWLDCCSGHHDPDSKLPARDFCISRTIARCFRLVASETRCHNLNSQSVLSQS